MSRVALRAWLLERQAEWEPLRVQVDGARLCARIVTFLDDEEAEAANEALTLAESAARSGLSAEHLGRLVRRGTIPNAGRRGAPRIRAADLPRKAAGRRARGRTSKTLSSHPYDPAADARSLASRQTGGAHGDPD